MKTKPFLLRLLAADLLLSWLLPSGLAATNIVKMGNYFFNPTNITIYVGDTITWSNAVLISHDTTQQTNLWHSLQLAQGQTFPFKFTNAGYYPYYCATHIAFHPEMTGTVSVVAAPTNVPPSAVTIFSPIFQGNAFSFSFATQTGYTYTAQFTPSLNPTNWSDFTNLPGNGTVVEVTDSGQTNASRFYRVGAK